MATQMRRRIEVTTTTMLGLLFAAEHAGAQEEPADAPRNVASQFVITLPSGWSIYDQSAALGQTDGTGVVIFSAEPVTKPGEQLADVELIRKVDSGEIASFFVDRMPAGKKVTCEKLPNATTYEIGQRMMQDPAMASPLRMFAPPPSAGDIKLGGCNGAKMRVEGQKKDPLKHWIVDVRAVSDSKFLFIFSLRNRADHYERNLPAFESALATVEFAQD